MTLYITNNHNCISRILFSMGKFFRLLYNSNSKIFPIQLDKFGPEPVFFLLFDIFFYPKKKSPPFDLIKINIVWDCLGDWPAASDFFVLMPLARFPLFLFIIFQVAIGNFPGQGIFRLGSDIGFFFQKLTW